MNTLQILCVAVCFLGAFAPVLGQNNCGSTKFYIQNIKSGDVLTYEPNDNDILLVTQQLEIPQQLWEYKGQQLYNTYNNAALTVGPCIADTCVLTLKNVTECDSKDGDQKWDFRSDGALASLSGYTASAQVAYTSRILIVAHKNIIIPNSDEIFKVVLAPV